MAKPLFSHPQLSQVFFPMLSGATPIAPTVIGLMAPASPTVGQLWWRNDLGKLFIYYDDGTSQQWVPVTPV
jgi:hypothetical protein